jgi:hypothetical protein
MMAKGTLGLGWVQVVEEEMYMNRCSVRTWREEAKIR